MKTFSILVAIALGLVVSPDRFRAADSFSVWPAKMAVPDSRRRYFPEGVFSSNKWQDRYKANWYSKALAAMNEPSLSLPRANQKESYRLLWLPSFDHPVSVRLWRSGSRGYLVVKQLSGAGGYNPGKLAVSRRRALSVGEWDEFTRLLEQSSYWKLSTDDGEIGTDGAQWVLEGTIKGRYHVVDRWSPQDGNYREVCSYLLKLTKLELRRIY